MSTQIETASTAADTAIARPLLNVAAVLHGPRDIRIEHRAYTPPGPDEVTVRIRATGLCGSDLHYFQHGRNGDFALQHPMCLGHESVGDVVAVGANVVATMPHFAAARHQTLRAVIEPGLNCTACEYCLSGRYNLCPTLRFASSAKTAPHLDGTLQRYINWPARLVHIIPPTMSLYSAALIEPLAVVLQALSRSQLEPGQSVLVIGAGAVGLLACAAAKAFGASFVSAVDIDEGRLAFARENGWVDAVYCTRPAVSKPAASNTRPSELSRTEQDQHDMASAKRQAQDLFSAASATSSTGQLAVGSSGGFDVVYECTGVPACVHLSIFAAKTGGRTVLIGMGHPIMAMPLGAAALREVDILGVFRYANMFPKAIRLISSGVIPSQGGRVPGINGRVDEHETNAIDRAVECPGPTRSPTLGDIATLVSHTYPLEKTTEAFETLQAGQSPDGKRVVKVFIVDDDDEDAAQRKAVVS